MPLPPRRRLPRLDELSLPLTDVKGRCHDTKEQRDEIQRCKGETQGRSDQADDKRPIHSGSHENASARRVDRGTARATSGRKTEDAGPRGARR